MAARRRHDGLAPLADPVDCGLENPGDIADPAAPGDDGGAPARLQLLVGDRRAAGFVLLTANGAWLATKGYADGIQKEGFQPLKEVIQSIVVNSGQI